MRKYWPPKMSADEADYEDSLDDVCSKYAQDLLDEIEDHYPKGFFTEENIKGIFEGILSEMFREIKPYERKTIS